MSVDPLGTSGTAFNTLTHARLRAAQGDVDGARAILARMLDQNTEPDEARAFLRDLDGRSVTRIGEPENATRARIDTLEAWLRRVRHNAGGGRD